MSAGSLLSISAVDPFAFSYIIYSAFIAVCRLQPTSAGFSRPQPHSLIPGQIVPGHPACYTSQYADGHQSPRRVVMWSSRYPEVPCTCVCVCVRTQLALRALGCFRRRSSMVAPLKYEIDLPRDKLISRLQHL